ncbi:pentapeptide repeat-containing protein [aff. Roholtiella sp. LEGE 12411]|uniref:pentapeptide repeat-containing protein n=1 Tax=aff. Roholtiella sp. LEGE 12411 TaxID=1828822 RepID=UPI001880D28C|nr:pentapeptide repeat-containing protein [aff. Roholtiella sp. LEGE 12411]MBE9036946.1 pentapeptide repeat-containing protein [aff. Roholtiella sp. LEGE 12411]
MINEEHYARLKESVQGWNEWRVKNPEIIPDLREANLSEANLSGANLSRADLTDAYFYRADLREANLSGANLSRADLTDAYFYRANLSEANLNEAYLVGVDLSGANRSNTYLKEADDHSLVLSGANLNGANLSNAFFFNANLSYADLSGANLSYAFLFDANLSRTHLNQANLSYANFDNANLSYADLSGANLSHADLIRTQALGANFTSAIFTGACLEDWNYNYGTKLNNIDCQYVYLKSDKQERRPSSGEFAPGEFTKLFQKALETVDLIFRNGVDWEAFAYSFRKTQVENESSDLAIQNIEIKGDGMVVVGVKVSSSADKAKFHSDFVQGYEFAHKVLSERYKAEISSKDAQIVHYGEQVQRQGEYINNLFYLLNQQQTVQKAMAENPGKISNNNFYNPQFGGGFVDAQTVNAQQIDGNITNYAPDMRQNLAEAGAEIQQLLNQLAQTNPTTDAVTEAIHQEIKRNPTLKARLISALKAGVLEGLKTFVNHPLFNIPAETIKGFLEAE